MDNTENEIYFNFSYFALRLLGKGLYSNHWTAISELVANGFDAQAELVKIYINLINQEKATIEIFDNGTGMDYADLSEKYAFIGMDKREDAQLSEEVKRQLMGRKGIGKLAALFLSNKYYLVSKKDGVETAWCLDASDAKDSDIPKLERCVISDIGMDCKKEWEEFATGTLIKLTNVNLTNFGAKTVEALKARLSDFYLTDELIGKMEVCVIHSSSQPRKFEEVKKAIAFKNFYAFFNNTGTDLESQLASSVQFYSSIDEIASKQRKVRQLEAKKYTTAGEQQFQMADGTLSKEKLSYQMSGWIGIHTSIKKEEAQKNDPEYLKNKAYRPNQLRLYVRKKLAVENFLDYVKNTQAFANYIEGEISFDILDDNDLGDIATSNRQGFVEDNDRIQLLISILKPIISALIKERASIGTQINQEEKEYHDAEREKFEREMEEEERKRSEVERERDDAVIKKKQAEKEATNARERAENLNRNLGSEKKRNHFLTESLGEDQFNFAKRLHMVRINTVGISKEVKLGIMKLQRGKFQEADAWNCLKNISYYSSRMQAILNYSGLAQFDTSREFINGDIFDFVDEYVSTVIDQTNDIKVEIDRKFEPYAEMKFNPQSIAVIIDNIVSNSIKNNASILNILLDKEANVYIMDFKDNGDGLNRAVDDVNELFEFGKGYTSSGTGVGLFHVKDIVEEEMRGTVTIDDTYKQGFSLKVRFAKV